MVEDPVGTSPRSYAWYEVWWNIFLRPTQETFCSVLADPKASATRAYEWVAMVMGVGGLLGVIVLKILRGPGYEDEQSNLTLLLEVITAMVSAVVGLKIHAGITHWIAKKFGGQGTGDNLVYFFGAIDASLGLISSLLNMLEPLLGRGEEANLQMASLLYSAAIFALIGYVLFLYVQAVRAGEQLSVGKAILTVLIPSVVVFALFVMNAIYQAIYL